MDWEDFYEGSEFDRQIEEFKDALREDVKRETLEEIERLKKELDELRDFKERKDEIEKEYREKMREAKIAAAEAEHKWKNARLHALLGEYLVGGFTVKCEFIQGPKCSKCDENRRIHFKSPSGRDMSENCLCDVSVKRYIPVPIELYRINAEKLWGKDEFVFSREWSEDYGDFYYARNIVRDLEHPEEINTYSAMFLDKELCQKYCDWLNDRGKEAEA